MVWPWCGFRFVSFRFVSFRFLFYLHPDKSVSIKGLSDKWNITLTFVITLAGDFLPLQIIYAGKTKRCHPNFQFPSGFCISQNPKHWSNEEETMKLIDKIIIPYIVKKRSELNLPATQKALVIWEVCWKGTGKVEVTWLWICCSTSEYDPLFPTPWFDCQ